MGSDGNALMILISINAIFFITVWFLQIIYYMIQSAPGSFESNMLPQFIMPAKLLALAKKPWTVFTNMFVHLRLITILTNMLWLWAFGYILQDLTGRRKLIPIFLYGAFGGAIAFIAAYHIIPALKANVEEAQALGASAGIMAIAIATTLFSPNYRVFPMLNGGIPLWVITLIFVIIDLATIPYRDPGAHIAHLAGGATGFLFVFLFRKGYDGSNWINAFFDWVNNLFNPDKPKRGKSIKQQLFYKSHVQPFKKSSNLTQQRIDELLDKINQRGYQSLTDDEKELLKRASKEDL